MNRRSQKCLLGSLSIIYLGHSNFYLCVALPEHCKTYQSVRKKKNIFFISKNWAKTYQSG